MTPTSHTDIIHNLAHWQHIADKMADKYNKQFNVVENEHNEYVVFPASVEPRGLSKTVYSVGGEKYVETGD